MLSGLDDEMLALPLGQEIPAEDRQKLKVYYEQIAKAFNESLKSIGEGPQPPFLFQA